MRCPENSRSHLLSQYFDRLVPGGVSGRRLGSELDLVSQRVEPLDQAQCDTLFGQMIEIRLPQIPKSFVAAEHLEHSNQDLVGDRHQRTLGALTGLEPVILGLVVAALPASRRGRRGEQRRLEMRVALAGGGRLGLAGALPIAWTHPGPCRQAL